MAGPDSMGSAGSAGRVRFPAPAAGGGSSTPGGWDADDATVPLVLLAVVAGALLASLWVVVSASSLLAEMPADGVLVGGLYHRLRRKTSGRWLAIALRKTAIPFFLTCLLFVLAGWYLQARLPGARSMWDVVRHL